MRDCGLGCGLKHLPSLSQSCPAIQSTEVGVGTLTRKSMGLRRRDSRWILALPVRLPGHLHFLVPEKVTKSFIWNSSLFHFNAA
jgi:hypothetical protein